MLSQPSLPQSNGDPGRGEWLYGRAGTIDHTGQARYSMITAYKNWRGARFSRSKLLTENFICQMATFFTRDLWVRAGGLDIHLHLDMDYDLWLRFARDSTPTVIDDVLADFRIHAGAKGTLQTGAQLDARLPNGRPIRTGAGRPRQAEPPLPSRLLHPHPSALPLSETLSLLKR